MTAEIEWKDIKLLNQEPYFYDRAFIMVGWWDTTFDGEKYWVMSFNQRDPKAEYFVIISAPPEKTGQVSVVLDFSSRGAS